MSCNPIIFRWKVRGHPVDGPYSIKSNFAKNLMSLDLPIWKVAFVAQNQEPPTSPGPLQASFPLSFQIKIKQEYQSNQISQQRRSSTSSPAAFNKQQTQQLRTLLKDE